MARTNEPSILRVREKTGLPVEDAEDNRDERKFMQECNSQQPLWQYGIKDKYETTQTKAKIQAEFQDDDRIQGSPHTKTKEVDEIEF